MQIKKSFKKFKTLLLVFALVIALPALPISTSYAESDPNVKNTEFKPGLDRGLTLNLIELLTKYYSLAPLSYNPPVQNAVLLLQSVSAYFFVNPYAQLEDAEIKAEENKSDEIIIQDQLLSSFKVSEALEELFLSKAELVREGRAHYIKDPNSQATVRAKSKGCALVRSEDMNYCVGASGALKEGFCKFKDFYYYSEGEKGLARGWRELNSKLYYFSPVDGRMYRNGVYSTGEGVYWFGEDGAVREGERPGGHVGLPIVWHRPKPEELTNKWLGGDNQKLRFRGQEIANYAASFEGLPFKWFGNDLNDESGVYCCGTVYAAYRAFGIDIPGPDDLEMELNDGFEMVQHQHDRVKEFGGELIPNDLTRLLPGDIVLHMSPLSPIEYTHVGIFMGYNGDIPYYLHATIKDGVIVESVHMANEEWGAWFSDKFMRYNTEENKGIYPYPRHQGKYRLPEELGMTEREDRSEESEQGESSEE